MLLHDPKAGELLPDLLIEIEIVGPSQDLPSKIDWTKWNHLRHYIEPGVHGLDFTRAAGARRLYPSEMFGGEIDVREGLSAMAQVLHQKPSEVENTKLARFRTAHWYERASGDAPVQLHRGMIVLPAELVTERSLTQAAENLAEYIVHRQKQSGLFSYQFDAGRDQFSDEDNLVRQVSSTMAMSRYARTSGKSAPLAAADRAIAYHLQGLTPIAGEANAAFIATADGRNKLGVSALLALAMMQHPDQTRYADQRDKLSNGILHLQRDSGLFLTAFPPAQELRGQEYFPGEALLALAAEYDRRPNERILIAFDRAIDFYRDYFRAKRTAAFVPWQVQAFAKMSHQTKRRDFIDFVFELTDWQLERQISEKNCPWPELLGGFDSPDGPTAASAAYLEALCDALEVARTANDETRVARYEGAIRQAARFVMQLQFRPEEAWFARSPKNAIHGIRSAPGRSIIRIDHCAHALTALVKAKESLFPTS